MSHVSPYTSPFNQSSSFGDGSSSLLQPSPLGSQTSPLFQPLSSSSAVYNSTPQSSFNSPQNISGPRTISPVIIRPVVSTNSPSPSEIEKCGSVTPTGPLSPLVPPPDLEISSQVSPSHALAPPVPLSAASPEPPSQNVPMSSPTITPPSHNVTMSSPTITIPIPSRPTIPTSFSIAHLSSNLPLDYPTSSPSTLLPPQFDSPSCRPSLSLSSPIPPSLPLSSALPPAFSVPHLSSPPLPASHLLSLVHNAPMSLVHNAPPAILSPPGGFLPRSCRKFSCTLCSALFSFESNAKRHFLSQHNTGEKPEVRFTKQFERILHIHL